MLSAAEEKMILNYALYASNNGLDWFVTRRRVDKIRELFEILDAVRLVASPSEDLSFSTRRH